MIWKQKKASPELQGPPFLSRRCCLVRGARHREAGDYGLGVAVGRDGAAVRGRLDVDVVFEGRLGQRGAVDGNSAARFVDGLGNGRVVVERRLRGQSAGLGGEGGGCEYEGGECGFHDRFLW